MPCQAASDLAGVAAAVAAGAAVVAAGEAGASAFASADLASGALASEPRYAAAGYDPPLKTVAYQPLPIN